MQSRSTLGVLIGLAIIGCGGSQSGSGSNSWVGHDDATGHDVNITQGPLPAGQTFTGVYRSAQIGDINVVQTGDSILGRYEYDRADCHVLGRLEGSASGNLFRFSWREDRRACGHIEPLSGRGYFLPCHGRHGRHEPATIVGQVGISRSITAADLDGVRSSQSAAEHQCGNQRRGEPERRGRQRLVG